MKSTATLGDAGSSGWTVFGPVPIYGSATRLDGTARDLFEESLKVHFTSEAIESLSHGRALELLTGCITVGIVRTIVHIVSADSSSDQNAHRRVAFSDL